MPELPEVETVRRQAQDLLIGEKITSIEVRRASIVRGDIHLLEGQTVVGVRRFAKLLVLDFSGGVSMAIHLKMTGRLSLFQNDSEFFPHTHVIFTLSRGGYLTFSDMRRFGYLQVSPTEKILQLQFVKTLGKEPLLNLTLKDFDKILAASKRPIKLLLLDQTKISGIGNIYANEALWLAKIHPKVAANTLKGKVSKRLFEAIEAVLKEGIARGGASDNSYRDLKGEKGHYQDFFKVYGRQGKLCPRGNGKIKRFALGGRGTFICEVCQKM